MAILTLTSDYGLKDPYLAKVKGRILSEIEGVQLQDISHEISPFDLQEAAYVFSRSYSFFPKGTIHLILLDEEAQNHEGILIAKVNDHYFILADNGLLSMILGEAIPEQIVKLDLRNEHLSEGVSHFVKAASHLRSGVKMELLGKPVKNWVEKKQIQATYSEETEYFSGVITYVDNYGNIATNISETFFRNIVGGNVKSISINRWRKDIRLVTNYREGRDPSEILAVFNSFGFLELGIYRSMGKEFNGANSLLGIGMGDIITLKAK